VRKPERNRAGGRFTRLFSAARRLLIDLGATKKRKEPTMANERETVFLEEPPLARVLFGDTRLAWLWLPLRIFLGWEWLEAGLHKFSDPAWMNGGTALRNTGSGECR
jgi:hypothetical protein